MDTHHPYLESRGFTPNEVEKFNLVQSPKGIISMPLEDTDGKVWSAYGVDADGKKGFVPKCHAYGCFHRVRTPTEGDPILIATGFATATTIHLATGYSVATAVTPHNLMPVAQALRDKHPDA